MLNLIFSPIGDTDNNNIRPINELIIDTTVMKIVTLRFEISEQLNQSLFNFEKRNLKKMFTKTYRIVVPFVPFSC